MRLAGGLYDSDRMVKVKGILPKLRRGLPWVVLAAAAALILILALSVFGTDSSKKAASRISHRLSDRMEILSSFMQEVMDTDPGEWPALENFPSDMVVYRYLDDTLQSWNHQFTLDNDDISRRMYTPVFVGSSYSLDSPLREVDTIPSLMNFGPKWYVVKKIVRENSQVFGGIEIKNTESGRAVDVNPRLGVSDRIGIYPITEGAGVPVSVEGVPLMKIVRENTSYLSNRMPLFSPTVYADGRLFFSLGNVLIIHLLIFLAVMYLYLRRRKILRWIQKGDADLKLFIYGAAIVLAIGGICFYINVTFRSIIMNSNITLELYHVSSISRYTVYVYIAFLLLSLTIPMLLQMLRPTIKRLSGVSFNVFSRWGRMIFAIACATYFVAMSSVLGFRREQDRVEIWANRLSLDRDLGFELQLRSMERSIANDPVISSFINVENGTRLIMSRLSENYVSRISQDYEVDVYISRDSDQDRGVLDYFSSRIASATAIADSSHFLYSRTGNGRAEYTGIFLFYNSEVGVTRLLMAIESKLDKEGRGYSEILGNNGPGTVSIPQRYSYGNYQDSKLVSYRGDYAYPTVLTGRLNRALSSDTPFVKIDGYTHFLYHITDDDTESTIISRPSEDFTKYMVAGFLVALLAYFLVSLPREGRRRPILGKNYYKQRINTVLYISLTGTLIIMAVISVYFVYRRNEANVTTLMTGKINTIQSLLEADCRYYTSYEDFGTQESGGRIEEIGNFTKSDITLYTTQGKVFKSTYPEIFDRMLLGSRTDDEAYRNIMYRNRRFFIHRERFSNHSFYAMYAPVFNGEGDMLAIVGAPYTDTGLDFRSEAIFHSLFIITVFFILLILTRFVTGKVVENLFRPLGEMGAKMNSARTGGLEYIIYERDDEISSLVRAYNLMVHDLSESTKQVAQVERDKAWSEMARQVAHEIKNPLTPIKLQIQRIIRLKSKNDPKWEEKFDSIVPVIMDSIDGLTETANEFSTFAKLYSEEPVVINLDRLAMDQIALFDDKDEISFQYMGLQDATVLGPKPQLTRVFVNLLTNSVQAITNQQNEDISKGKEPKHGQVTVSVRNSSKEGFLDIVVEDNGPGVKDEDRGKLFTPNFTTKSSGTGLGLAICKNIIERCGGDIQYSRSFVLQGACFTIRIPKYTGE